MCTQRKGFRVLRTEAVDQLGPQQPGRAHLRDLHEDVHADGPEEAQPRGERVDVEAGIEACPQVLDAVRQRVRELEIGGRAGFLDVVAGDRDRVELRHPRGRVAEDVADDPHRRGRRVDVGVADHELFEDVVLDRPGELLRRHPLLLGGDDVEREDRQHRAVHRHRDAHPVERDAVEELAHVVDRVDRDAGHADVAADAHVVAVVAAVGGQVEGDRQALLAGGEIAAVEGVGLLGGGEAGVLADGPRLGRVHRRVRARAGTAGSPGQVSQEVQVLGVFRRCRAGRARCLPGSARRARTGPCRPPRAPRRPSVSSAAGDRLSSGVPRKSGTAQSKVARDESSVVIAQPPARRAAVPGWRRRRIRGTGTCRSWRRAPPWPGPPAARSSPRPGGAHQRRRAAEAAYASSVPQRQATVVRACSASARSASVAASPGLTRSRTARRCRPAAAGRRRRSTGRRPPAASPSGTSSTVGGVTVRGGEVVGAFAHRFVTLGPADAWQPAGRDRRRVAREPAASRRAAGTRSRR